MRRLLAGLVALVALLPVAAGAAEELELPAVTRVTLDNGLRLVVAESHELPLVEFYAMIGAGAAQDPADQLGLASLTAASVTRGAGKLDAEEFARAVESLAGGIAAAAGTDGTIVNAEFLSEDFDRGLDLLRLVLREPTFAADEVRRAREQQLAGLVADLEEPTAIAERCFAAFLYGGYSYGRPIDGRHKTVAGLGRGDVRKFHARWWRPNATVLAIVGDVATDRIVARVREALGGWTPSPEAIAQRAGPPPPVEARRVLLVDKPDATQTQLRAGAIAMARNAPDLLPAQVANTVLGGGFTSKLIEELRVKRSLTYGASSGFAARLTGGDFRMATFTKSATTAETLGLALDVEGSFRRGPIDPQALRKAKAYLAGQFPLRLESPDALAARLAEIEFFGLPPDELVTYRTRLAAVTDADAERAAERWMPDPDRMAIVVVGNAAEVREQLEARFGPVQSTTPEGCDALAVSPPAAATR
ncbi:MAG: insulinase family protein [bacterium]|nr:insulinase family protein [bacterium]